MSYLNAISLLGLIVMVGLAWLMSSYRWQVNWPLVLKGTLLQLILAAVLFNSQNWTFDGRFPNGILFYGIDSFFGHIRNWTGQGSAFVFQAQGLADGDATNPLLLVTTFAFGVMPTVIFFATLMSVLYYIGIMHPIVKAIAWMMQKVLGTSGSESLAAAANVFIGQTEAPLVVRPYIVGMTRSELNALMIGGFATISGGVMAVFVSVGISAGHLVTASLISAPAALVIAKILQPETQPSQTMGTVNIEFEKSGQNVIEAAAIGASDGMRLVINIVAMLIAFLALIAMVDTLLMGLGELIQAGINVTRADSDAIDIQWSLAGLFAIVFWPLAWVMGIQSSDCAVSGQILGTKTVVNEFVAYLDLGKILSGEYLQPSVDGTQQVVSVSARTEVILTYALCGFSNFSSIGIQIGGIGPLAPERRSELAQLGLRAMIGGTLACCMTACVAGMLYGLL